MMQPFVRPLPLPATRQLPVAGPGQRTLASLLGLLPALFGTPRRALFTSGVLVGVAVPILARIVASRALELATGRGRSARGRAATFEAAVIEQVFASRTVIRRVHSD